MGYSCNMAASRCQDFILKRIINGKTSNEWTHNGETYFYERGREHRDGAITGTIWRFLPDGIHVHKAGSYRIEPDGFFTRWNNISPKVRLKAREAYDNGDFSDANNPFLAIG